MVGGIWCSDECCCNATDHRGGPGKARCVGGGEVGKSEEGNARHIKVRPGQACTVCMQATLKWSVVLSVVSFLFVFAPAGLGWLGLSWIRRRYMRPCLSHCRLLRGCPLHDFALFFSYESQDCHRPPTAGFGDRKECLVGRLLTGVLGMRSLGIRTYSMYCMYRVYSMYSMFSTVQYCSVLFSTVQYCTVLFSTVQYCSVPFGTVQYCTVLFSTVQYCPLGRCTSISINARRGFFVFSVFALLDPNCNRASHKGGLTLPSLRCSVCGAWVSEDCFPEIVMHAT